MKIQQALDTTFYRLRQTKQQLGFVAPLTVKEYQEVARWLPASAFALFHTMSLADQRHSLRVCQRLQERGCTEQDMLAAALLHDVGKAQGRVPFWTRAVIVLGKRLAPHWLARTVVDPEMVGFSRLQRWRCALSYAWYHAEVGAHLAAASGLTERAALYIRTHHDPAGPAAALYRIDEVS